MNEHVRRYFLEFIVIVSVLFTLSPNAYTADVEHPQFPPARKIPGLTVEDKFPDGCVDCHINMPDIKQDERISVLMSKWLKKVEPKLLKKAQAAAPAGVTLKGVHPPADKSLRNIPDGCSLCHSKISKKAPPLAALLHTIHLTGGEENHYLTIFQGECTYCHKMNPVTGVWSMPSGPER